MVHDGAWGFAAADAVTPEQAAVLAERAVALAAVSRPLATTPVELAPEPVHADAEWVSAYRIDPWTVPDAERVSLLQDWSARLLAAGVDHVDASVHDVKECVFYADSAGTSFRQQRVRCQPAVTAVRDRPGRRLRGHDDDRPPGGRAAGSTSSATGPGTGTASSRPCPSSSRRSWRRPPSSPGRYTLVIDPTNLWLTIHESVGHATEYDRALGYEANYAGTSFATPDRLGTLRYGSELMTVTGDRTVEHGLATVGYDDEGVAAQSWDLVRDGVLVGYQLDRAMAAAAGRARSNGCAYADSAEHVPIQRMPNVSLLPAPDGPDLDGLLAGVEDGIYVVGDKSWSIDMQRYNFQFTGQRFYRIRAGRLAGQLRHVAYQSNTLDFWGSLAALGGPSTYLLAGAFNCGKGQPGQVAPVSHGCPAAVFTDVNVLNSAREAGR